MGLSKQQLEEWALAHARPYAADEVREIVAGVWQDADSDLRLRQRYLKKEVRERIEAAGISLTDRELTELPLDKADFPEDD